MHHRTRFLVAAFVTATFFGAASAHAADCPPGALQMADGSYYLPSSGRSAPNCGRLLEPASPTEQPPSIEGAPPVELPAPDPHPLRTAIGAARELLLKRLEEVKASREPKHVAGYDVWIDVTLAVWNRVTGEIRLIEARKNGFRMEPPESGVRVHRNNGVNSEFLLDGPDDVVVGVRYPIFVDVSTSAKKPRYRLDDVVYVPYSKRLHQEEIVDWGRATLDANAKEAYAQLRASGVRSRAFPDRLLADVISQEQLETIAVIEHLSEGSLLGANARFAMESVFVVLGANQDDAYAYSRSSAGARGLFQFMPATYKGIASRRELGLDPSFEGGMADPVNAIRAAVAYLDDELSRMPLAVKDLYHVNNDRVIEYLAAAYNSGGTRIRRAVAMWGDAWSEPHDAEIAALAKKKGANSLAVTQMKNATLHGETVAYVKKLRQTLVLMRPSPLARM